VGEIGPTVYTRHCQVRGVFLGKMKKYMTIEIFESSQDLSNFI